MRSRHYIEEIGVASPERPVSTPVSVVVLALLAVVAILLIQRAATFKPVPQAAVESSTPVQVARR